MKNAPIMKRALCNKPQPKGFICVRDLGHDGDCTLTPKPHWYDSLLDAIGEVLYGGGR
jgi:hypothetical protein